MMRELVLIGIGTGNPAHVTLEGRQAIKDAAAFLVPHKGAGKEDLAHLRHAILEAAGATAPRIEFEMPKRDLKLPYLEGVERWHDAIAERWQACIEGVREGPVAVLVWGDPGLYDSTLRIARRLDPTPKIRVVPGITALQALTAAHAIPFNTLGGAVSVTTGRNLRDKGWPEGFDTVAVMLDGECSFQTLPPDGTTIWWGAFLGMPEQILDSGPLHEASHRIRALRAAARERHGWIMDTYMLRNTDKA